jgi:hypothetical protein
MSNIQDLIKKSINPFSSVTWYSGNFWTEPQESDQTVRSIHQKEYNRIVNTLDRVEQDRQTRTILLTGDSGSGKSYLLGRLRRELRTRAFFSYISPWTDDRNKWRHILRYTVESLMQKNDDRQESQLLLWLKGLSALKEDSLIKKIWGERNLFVRNFKMTYPTGIYHSNDFFNSLYSLTQKDLFFVACDWLKGEDLDKESRAAIGVKKSFDSETDAFGILSNFCKLSEKTQPIVLCFDQTDAIAKEVFQPNTTIHNENLRNLLIVISMIGETWRDTNQSIPSADKDRVHPHIWLKQINLDRVEEILEKRLLPIHQQADPKPPSPIYPIRRQKLEEKFPGGKTDPRAALQLGYKEFQQAKIGKTPPPTSPLTVFQLYWEKEFHKNTQKIDRIRNFSAPELVKMLQEVLAALEVQNIKPYLLKKTKYSNYSFSYVFQQSKIGIVWSEDPNLKSFFSLMRACENLQKQKTCDSLILIRAEKIGQPHNQGYKKFKKLFSDPANHHITPHIDSVCYLATYHNLVNAANSKELTIQGITPDLPELESLVRQSEVLHQCMLLQNLGIVPASEHKVQTSEDKVKSHMLNLIKNDQLLGREVLIDNTATKYFEFNKFQLNQIVEQLIQNDEIRIVDGTKDPKDQLLYLVSNQSN